MISGTSNRLYTFHDRALSKERIFKQEKLINQTLQADSTLPVEEIRKIEFYPIARGVRRLSYFSHIR